MNDLFTLQIETGNAAFDDGAGYEIARILESVATSIRENPMPAAGIVARVTIRDSNGNTVGHYGCGL